MRRPVWSGACRGRPSNVARSTAWYVSKTSQRLLARRCPADHRITPTSRSLESPTFPMLDFAPTPPSDSSPDFETFRRRAYQITGLDLTCYKVPQMHRRLSVLL